MSESAKETPSSSPLSRDEGSVTPERMELLQRGAGVAAALRYLAEVLDAQQFGTTPPSLLRDSANTIDRLLTALASQPVREERPQKDEPRPLRAHVIGCRHALAVPVDLCQCGGRDVFGSASSFRDQVIQAGVAESRFTGPVMDVYLAAARCALTQAREKLWDKDALNSAAEQVLDELIAALTGPA